MHSSSKYGQPSLSRTPELTNCVNRILWLMGSLQRDLATLMETDKLSREKYLSTKKKLRQKVTASHVLSCFLGGVCHFHLLLDRGRVVQHACTQHRMNCQVSQVQKSCKKNFAAKAAASFVPHPSLSTHSNHANHGAFTAAVQRSSILANSRKVEVSSQNGQGQGAHPLP